MSKILVVSGKYFEYLLENIPELSITEAKEEDLEKYLPWSEELNNIAEIYGHGTGAQSARSIKEEDIVKIVKPTLSSGTKVNDYGTKVKYKLNESGKVEFSWYKNGTLQGPKATDDTNFTYLDGNTWKTLAKGQSVILTNTYKLYNISSSNEKLSNLLTKEKEYWLGSAYISSYGGYVYCGVRRVSGGVRGYPFFSSSSGDMESLKAGIRPVISLRSDIVFSEYAVNVWKIQQ